MEDPRAAADSVGATRTWRREVMGASGLNLMAGAWLIVSPFVLGYGEDDPIWNPVIFGAILATLALLRASGAYRQSWMSGINATLGAWIFASAFWLPHSATAAWNALITGAIVMAFGIWSMSASEEGRRQGRSRPDHRGRHHPPTSA